MIGLCCSAVAFDGYDLTVYGATLPALLKYEPWGITEATAGVIGSYALIGMLFGALIAGPVTDAVGRRRVLLFGVTWFSAAMAGCAVATSVEMFGICRLLCGLGLGAVLPTATALTAEYSPPHRRSRNHALMFSGYPLGGIVGGVLAMVLVPEFGFRMLYWIGAAPLLFLVPLLFRYLPDSMPDRSATGRERVRDQVRMMRQPRFLLPTLLFSATSFFGLLLVYGLNTWLPQIMRSAGYPLSGSLLFLAILNLGAVIGLLTVAPFGDRLGMKPVTVFAFGAAAISIFLLSLEPPPILCGVLVAVAGFGTIGTQTLVLAYIAIHFPAEIRATALGCALGLGRFGAIAGPTFGGLLLAAGAEPAWNFYAFSIPAAIGAGIVLLLPKRAKVSVPVGVITPAGS